MTTGLMDREMAKAKLRAEAALAVGWNLNEQRIADRGPSSPGGARAGRVELLGGRQ